ncbi:ChaN family lipoprotein [Ottowia thiooxydans]|uniref:ChaN family lipoprotein n=1 Tax=Ottowia thiooxydans TaxID=219182 RepID=UPI00048E8ABB|nr:ChaN family lipoprotein [Ottowia thiooxydans]
MNRRLLPLLTTVLASLMLTACGHAPTAHPWTAAEQAQLTALLPTDALLLGEQHDAPEHHQLERQVVEWLAQRGALAAVAMEMAPRGKDTRALSSHATDLEVRAALDWNDAGWPWKTYGPVVMAAVKAGVPVLGANLPTAQQRSAMRDTSLDARLSPSALATQQQRIRDGHCDLLPPAQILPMTRIQIARDLAMAHTVVEARKAGHTVLLVAGNGHVERALGVPAHLPADLSVKVISALAGQAPTQAGAQTTAPVRTAADLIWPTPPLPPKDYCAQIRDSVPSKPATANPLKP